MGVVAKAFLYFGFYVLLHFAYEATGWEVLRPIAGTNESVFEHLKIGFFAYFFASLGEFAFLKRRPIRPREFWTSRLLATWSVPWTVVSVWYLAYAFTGKPLPLFAELLWALVVTFLSGIFGALIERGIEDNWIPQEVKGVLVVLFLTALAFFVAFTYRAPVFDLFVPPSLSHTLAGQ
ncbi:DUF6512 family protein [Candidatus Caldatribacterium sp.]|uniref:DUF6512 family protein n=1 Tax=Candidatus Caldatribacterium sp. TaxID=2282143 RepID=UPI00299A5A33|nr:DUF6512 family protein [Candidatus Caldatribacterium sp.]MDW8081023.1 DUF6512 family protein [Candidatus Calescibacterium sp.]